MRARLAVAFGFVIAGAGLVVADTFSLPPGASVGFGDLRWVNVAGDFMTGTLELDAGLRSPGTNLLGDVDVQLTLDVAGATTLDGGLNSPWQNVLGWLRVSSLTELDGGLNSPQTNALGPTTVTGAAHVTGLLSSDGGFNSPQTNALGSTNVTGAATVSGALTVDGGFNSTGTNHIGKLSVTGESNFDGGITVSGVNVVLTTRGLTAGAGLSGGGDLSADRTFATDSTEAAFLASGALTCGAGTAGKVEVHTTPLQYCDNAATPALQYAAYGSSTGESTAAGPDSVALTTDTTGDYVASLVAGNLIDVGAAAEGGTPTVDVDLSEMGAATTMGDGTLATMAITHDLLAPAVDVVETYTSGAYAITGSFGINTTPGYPLDVSGNTVLLGSDWPTGVVRTNNHNKGYVQAIPHYANASLPFVSIFAVSGSTYNEVDYGGGTISYNAATDLVFFTAATTTTPTGTERFRIGPTGIITSTSGAWSFPNVTTQTWTGDMTVNFAGGAGGVAFVDTPATGAANCFSVDGTTLSVDCGGKVGILLTAPAYTLEVGPSSAAAGATGIVCQRELATNGTDAVCHRAADSMAGPTFYTEPTVYPTADGLALGSTTAGVESWLTSLVTGPSGTVTFYDADSSHSTSLAANATTTASVAYTLPAADGAAGTFLQTSGIGAMTWASAASTLVGGAGIALSTSTFSADSTEAGFITAGALTCGAGTAGKMQTHTTPLQYCDNAATPALKYTAYGTDTGESTAAGPDSVALTTDTTGDYVASLVAGTAVNVGAAAEGGTPTVDWISTEVTDTTWGAGEADHVWTFNTTGTDPVLTTSDGLFTLAGDVTMTDATMIATHKFTATDGYASAFFQEGVTSAANLTAIGSTFADVPRRSDLEIANYVDGADITFWTTSTTHANRATLSPAGAFSCDSSVTAGTDLVALAQGDLVLKDADSSASVAIQAAAVTTTYALTLPDAAPVLDNSVPVVSTTGVVSWSTLNGRGHFTICGDADTVNDNTVYYGPDTTLVANTNGLKCDIAAVGNATEATADAPVYTSQAFQVLAMTCRNAQDANANISFTLRTAAGATAPSVTCTIADDARDCVADIQTTTAVAAGATVAIAAASTSDIGASNGFICEVEVAF